MTKSFNDALKELDSITDRLGMPIDKGIRKAVAALRISGFPTTGSCEGHLDRANPFPWVDIGFERHGKPSPNENPKAVSEFGSIMHEFIQKHGKKVYLFTLINWGEEQFNLNTRDGRVIIQNTSEEKIDPKLIKENFKHQQKILDLLQAFYKDSDTPVHRRIHLESHGIFGAFRIESQGGYILKSLPKTQRQTKLKEYQAEMNEFADFLITGR